MKGRWARFLLALGEALGSAAWALGLRRRVALEGLRRAFPERTEEERRATARDAYRQLGRSMAEIALSRGIRDADLEQLVRFEGWDRYESARARGRGVVVAVAHFGNWELLARATARRGVPLTAITRALRGRLNQRLLAARREGGLRELPDKGSSGAALRLLRRGETLAVVIDQNMRPSRGVFVEFFGEPACTTPAAAVLALRTGAPLLAVFPVRGPDGTHRVWVEGPFAPPPGTRGRSAVKALTQEVTRAVERAVRAHPDHWFWVHRRWKTRPPEGLPPAVR
ncbi:MAG TPA: lysophospholipid acyltransferase family protein [Myxococcales bacterium]|nr:lysophospholipid acyltransferase family protein [Myxococcales bacterium]